MKKSCGFLESFSMHAKRAEGQRISEWLKAMETFSFHNCIQTIELTTTIKEFQTRERVTPSHNWEEPTKENQNLARLKQSINESIRDNLLDSFQEWFSPVPGQRAL